MLVSYFTFRALKETLAQIQQTDEEEYKCVPDGRSNRQNPRPLRRRNVAFRAKNVSDGSSTSPPSDGCTRSHRRTTPTTARGLSIWYRLRLRPAYLGPAPGSLRELADCIHAEVSKIIEEQNLEHLRDQLFATVNFSEECLFMDDESECLSVDKDGRRKLGRGRGA